MHIISNVFFEQYVYKVQTFFNLSEMTRTTYHKLTTFVGKEKQCLTVGS